MKNLIYKEFKLAVHPTSFIFLTFGAMLLIPNYPYYVAFFYQTLGIFFMFLDGNTTNDIFFTALLPIRKKDIVTARFMTVIILEMLQIIVCIPFAVLRNLILPVENQAGMEANFALFGLVLIMLGIFNLVFLTMFYKTAYRAGAPYLVSCLAMTLFAGFAEAMIHLIPAWKTALDTASAVYLPQQLCVLSGGVILFVLLTVFAYQRSAKRFEILDL